MKNLKKPSLATVLFFVTALASPAQGAMIGNTATAVFDGCPGTAAETFYPDQIVGGTISTNFGADGYGNCILRHLSSQLEVEYGIDQLTNFYPLTVGAPEFIQEDSINPFVLAYGETVESVVLGSLLDGLDNGDLSIGTGALGFVLSEALVDGEGFDLFDGDLFAIQSGTDSEIWADLEGITSYLLTADIGPLLGRFDQWYWQDAIPSTTHPGNGFPLGLAVVDNPDYEGVPSPGTLLLLLPGLATLAWRFNTRPGRVK